MITWANKYDYKRYCGQQVHYHWSRGFEYSWASENSNILEGELVLDAAGGNENYISTMSYNKGAKIVVNADLDHSPKCVNNSKRVISDLRRLPFENGTFQRVICVSSLEHIDKPQQALSELWRVLMPGGRLLVTMDIADRECPSLFTITQDCAKKLLGPLKLNVPKINGATISRKIQTEQFGDFLIRVLCFYRDKIDFRIKDITWE